MENNKELDQFLQNQMAVDELGLGEPSLSLVEAARKKVATRKLTSQKPSGFTAVLNFILTPPLKYIQVTLSVFIIGMCLFYFNDQPASSKNSSDSSYTSINTHSLSNSSTLTCIQTTAFPER